MKQWKLIFLTALCLSLLISCASEPAVIDGVEVIFREDGTSFSYGEDVYHYQISGDLVEVTYPNGVTVFRKYTPNGYGGGFSGDGALYFSESDLEGYLSKDTVFQLLEGGVHTGREKDRGAYGLIGLFCVALGAFNCFAPEKSWYLAHGWHYRNAEPSDLSLGWIRVSGGVLLAAGAVLLVAGLF